MVKKLIGEGGVARVYQAEDTITGGKVALKRPRVDDPASSDALVNEYRFAALHRHPSLIAPLSFSFDYGSVALAQPLIEGSGIKSWWRDLSWETQSAREIIASILECVGFVHFSGYSYNDFKPANFMIVKDCLEGGPVSQRPILLDYNLVSLFDEKYRKRGTVEYLAPEVLAGESPGVASDMYSIGATIYELLTGEPPFTAPNSETLIKLITELGDVDYSKIPRSAAAGLRVLLSRNPEERPKDASEAAEILGLGEEFNRIFRCRVPYYLSSGPPPFAEELKEDFGRYIKGMSSKVFLIKSLNHDMSAISYLATEYETTGFTVWRAYPQGTDMFVKNVLKRTLHGSPAGKSDNTIIMIDKIEDLGQDTLRLLRKATGPKTGIPVAAGAARWTDPGIPVSVFDPVRNKTRKNATMLSLRGYLNRQSIDFDHDRLSRATGGDPRQVFHKLHHAIRDEVNLLSETADSTWAAMGTEPVEDDESMLRFLESLRKEGIQAIRRLSVWGDVIPMLVLSELNKNEQVLIDEMLRSGHLTVEKDAVSFPSGDIRDFVYESISSENRRKIHRFWADAVEKRLSETEGYLELKAIHWGASDDIEKGYKAVLGASREFLGRGELAKAREFAQKLRSLARRGGGPELQATILCADVFKTEGDYKSARRMYLEALFGLKTEQVDGLKARIYKDLGDLYRSLKRIEKSIYYTGIALKSYERLSDVQGIADCHNNMGLAYWVDERYDKALESFFEALRENEHLKNYSELAKIQSNIGIVKDIIGKTGEVPAHFIKGRDYAAEAGDPRLKALITNNLGYFFLRQGVYNKAIEYLQDALMNSEKIGYAEGTINALSNLGLCHMRSGDLFLAVDYNQKALEAAESIDSRHLAKGAEICLAEACILMGNYGLAEKVLRSTESGKNYRDDKSLRPQVELLRSRLLGSLGIAGEASKLAERVVKEASLVGDTRLRLEGELALAEARRLNDPTSSLKAILKVAEEASGLGRRDLMSAAAVQLAGIYIFKRDYFNAEGWIDRALSSPESSKETLIKGRILASELSYLKKKYDDAIENLIEIESVAAASGYIPLAARSSVLLAEIFLECSKMPRANEAFERASSYRARLISALPSDAETKAFDETPEMSRYMRLKISLADKKFLKI
jgi:serine/threonine protein kinase/tetratricopeptide (TPR) repeat protein